tara:strand:- start:2595 stop:2804 length:210 start_codon:yes stop_codon:yes gene_type:complete
MSSELKVDTLVEKTTDNGLAVDDHHFIDNIVKQSNTVGSGSIGSTENGAIIGPASITGTLTVAGNLRIL